MKLKASKVGDRVVAKSTIGRIQTGDAGVVVFVFPFDDRTNFDMKRRSVRFDEHSHYHVVSDDDLLPEPKPNAKKRNENGRFVTEGIGR